MYDEYIYILPVCIWMLIIAARKSKMVAFVEESISV
jgi:hypothetical protein